MRSSLFSRTRASLRPRGLTRPLAIEPLENRILLSHTDIDTTTFIKSFGGSERDFGQSVIETSDGGYAVLGLTRSFGVSNFDFWMLRLDANGDTLWQKTYGAGDNEFGRSVIQTSDGGFALAGFIGSGSFGAGTVDGWLLRLDADGNVLWQQTYGGTAYDDAFAIVQNADGGFTLAGGTRSAGAGSADFWVFRVDPSGTLLWQKTFGTPEYDFAFDIVSTTDGGYVITGGVHCFADCDFWVIRLDADGNLVFEQTYGGSAREFGAAVAATGDGGFVIVGDTESISSSRDAWVIKIDATGGVVWEKAFGGNTSDIANGIAEATDGSLIVTGGDFDPATGVAAPWLMKLDENGNVLWRKTFVAEGTINIVKSPFATSDGGYVATGRMKVASPTTKSELLVLKLNSDGNVLVCDALTDSITTVTNTSAAVGSIGISAGAASTLSVTPSFASPSNTSAVEELVCPLPPGDLLAALIEDVTGLNLPGGIENSLLVKLEGALRKLEDGNDVAAMNNLNAFIKEVEAQTGKKIPLDVADSLIDAAETIIALLSAS